MALRWQPFSFDCGYYEGHVTEISEVATQESPKSAILAVPVGSRPI